MFKPNLRYLMLRKTWLMAEKTGRCLIAFPQQLLPGTFNKQEISGGAAEIPLALHLDVLCVHVFVVVIEARIERLGLACGFQKFLQLGSDLHKLNNRSLEPLR
jgi:hypothetical protein